MDEVDAAQAEIEATLTLRIAAARGAIPVGYAADCDECGEWSGRLIEGVCAPCRDRRERYTKLNGR